MPNLTKTVEHLIYSKRLCLPALPASWGVYSWGWKIGLFFVVTILWNKCISAQPCFPEGIIFNTQSSIDSFTDNYPNCTAINGSVVIQGKGAGISSLAGLRNINFIGENLVISHNNSLKTLAGLDSLKFIQGTLSIWNNDSLSNLSGLNNVTYIGGDLDIAFNYSLTHLNALAKLTKMDGTLLQIWQNAALTSLAGLDSIQFDSIQSLYLLSSPNLSGCSIYSVCTYLKSGRYAKIAGNAVGCNSTVEILLNCVNSAGEIGVLDSKIEIKLYPVPAYINLNIKIETTDTVLYKIFDILGATVKAGYLEPNSVIDIESLIPGVYILFLTINNNMVIKPLIKQAQR